MSHRVDRWQPAELAKDLDELEREGRIIMNSLHVPLLSTCPVTTNDSAEK